MIHNGYLLHWFQYGLIGVILYITLYLKSLHLGYSVFVKFKNPTGLILFTFIICQMAKCVVWDTVIIQTNVTIIYIFIISLVIKIYQVESQESQNVNEDAPPQYGS